MNEFLYFLPKQNPHRGDLFDAGLGHAFGDQPFTQRQCTGPEQQPGTVCTPGEPTAEIGYFPNRQTWQPMQNKAAWLGFETAAPPGPDDLLRTQATATYDAIELGDGHRWLVPTAILANGESPLPKVRKLDENGAIIRRVQSSYERLYLWADELREAVQNGTPLTEERETEICIEALRMNYRLGLDEACALELLTDQAVTLIAYILIDRARWADAEGQLAKEK